MTKRKTNRYKKKQGGGRYAALAILALVVIAAGVGLLFAPFKRPVKQPLQPPSVAQKLPLPSKPRLDNLSAPKTGAGHVESPLYPTERAVPPITSPDAEKAAGKGRLAIIIDDMGSSMQEARALAGIGAPLTFSIIPGLRNYREVASFAAASGIETMIHIPMQSKGWPQRRLEENGLLVSMDDAAITGRLEVFIRDIPKAVGANNHMGSEFTEHEDKMRVVLGTLKARGLFFIDSVTSPQTAGLRLAHEMGMRSGRRDVFLDNEQNEAYIRGQFNQAIRLARKRGASIAICHPHPVTIKTLAALLPGLEKQGIALVPASRLVR